MAMRPWGAVDKPPLHFSIESCSVATNDQVPIEIAFGLTLRDLYKVYFHTLLRLWLVIPLVICMVALLAVSALSDFLSCTSYLIPALRFVTVAAALVGIGFALPYLLARNTMRTSPMIKGEIRYVFGEGGVETVTSASQSRMDWAGFHRAVELKDCILLYMSSRVFHIIPKKAFADASQLEDLKSLLRRKMEGKTRLKP
jgi:hypothetical protein